MSQHDDAVIDLFERSAAVFRSVLVTVRPDQADAPTPCAELSVAELVAKAVGHQDWLRASLAGDTDGPRYPPIDPSEWIDAFDRSTAALVKQARLSTDRTVTLAAGLQFSGADVVRLASRNIFQYAWDLARGTGQSTDLAPDVAGELLHLSRTDLVPQRGPGGFFGPEHVPPPGAPVADVLAGFLGRPVDEVAGP